jgi:hypothetical protein
VGRLPVRSCRFDFTVVLPPGVAAALQTIVRVAVAGADPWQPVEGS